MASKSKRLVFFLVLLVSIFLTVHPARISNEWGNLFIRNYAPAEYQSHPQNFAITQDHRGVVYIGNNMGILEFDGHSWTPVLQVKNRSRVRSLVTDRQGVVWVGATGDLGYLTYDQMGKLTYVSMVEKVPEKDREFAEVWNSHATSQGLYFFAQTRLFFWDEKKLHSLPPLLDRDGLVMNDCLIALQSLDSFCRMNKTQRITLPCDQKIDSREWGGYALVRYAENQFLVLTEKKGAWLGRINPGWQSLTLKKFDTEITPYLNRYGMAAGKQINDDLFCISTITGGLILMDKKGKILQVLNKNRGLPDNCVYQLFPDKQQNLWVALNYGFSYIEISSPLSKFGEANGLDGIVLNCTRYHGRLYAGTFNGIFCLPEYQPLAADGQHRFTQVENARDHCFYFLTLRDILIAGGRREIFQIKGAQANVLKALPGVPLSLGSTPRYPDCAFIGCHTGLFVVKIKLPGEYPNSGQWATAELVGKGNFAGVKNPIRRMVSDSNGDLWMTTEIDGIIRLKFKGSQVSDCDVIRHSTPDGLVSLVGNMVHWIDNQIVIGTESGIMKKADKFVPENTFGKLFNEKKIFVNHMAKDRKNQIWLDSGQGFCRISQQNGVYQWNFIPFKMITGEIEQFMVEDNGLVWLCAVSSRGLYRFDSSLQKNYQTAYHTMIRQVRAGKDRIVSYGNFYNPSARQGNLFTLCDFKQPEAMVPRLPYNENSIIFNYSATFYEQSGSNRFQYKLTGFDTDWSDWTDKLSKEYTNLPEGDYSFQVRSKNIFDHPGGESSFRFSIAAPWSRTIWAYLGYGLIFFGIFYGGIKINSLRLVAAKERLEKIVAERTAEVKQQKDKLEEVNKELQDFAYIVSHDLKAPLRGITTVSDWIREDQKNVLTEESREYFDLLTQRVERMKNLIHGVLEYSRAGRLEEKAESTDLNVLVQEIIDSMVPPEHISVTIDSRLPVISVGKVRITQLFQNLISNAIKYMDKPAGKVSVTGSDQGSHWQFNVSDNGPGIPEAHRERIFQIFQTLTAIDEKESTGVGLTVVKKLVEFFQGKIWIESQEGLGSTFSFTIKKNDSQSADQTA